MNNFQFKNIEIEWLNYTYQSWIVIFSGFFFDVSGNDLTKHLPIMLTPKPETIKQYATINIKSNCIIYIRRGEVLGYISSFPLEHYFDIGVSYGN